MKKLLKLFFSTLSYFLIFFALCNNQIKAELISPGEELFYEVSFLGINLGSIKLVTEPDEVLNNQKVYKVKAYMTSYKGIPFIDLKSIFESWLDPSVTYSHQFISNNYVSNGWDYQKINFDYNKGNVTNQKWFQKKKYYDLTFNTKKKWNDGLSLLFTARRFINLKQNIKIPTVMDRDTVITTINFHGKKEKVEIEAVPYPVKTIHFFGKADWTGIYGLSGNFEGWFSDDEAAIPIKAYMKVYVGNVLIELKNWKRKNWNPPKANN